MPKHWMWHLDHELDLWFKKVKADRDNKYSNNGSSSGVTGELLEEGQYDENIYYTRKLAEMKGEI